MKPAHVHLISVLATELDARNRGLDTPIRILDIGCGYGQLIIDLMRTLPSLLDYPVSRFEVYGLEVYEHRAGLPNYRSQILSMLTRCLPEVSWEDRIRICPAVERWPFDEGQFDLAFSNQVIEHVCDLPAFFAEQRRIVGEGGFAVHFYPSKEVLIEPHSGVPCAHWVADAKRRSWIEIWSRLGFGKYLSYRCQRGSTLDEFSTEFQNYLSRYVYFRSNRDIRRIALEESRAAGFTYGQELFRRRLADDWEPYRYPVALQGWKRSLLAPFTSSTLVQTF